METKRIFLDIPSNVEVEKIEMTDSVLLRFIKEEKYEPKDGDIVDDFKKGQIYSSDYGVIVVYDSTDERGAIMCSAFMFDSDYKGISVPPDCGCGYTREYKPATPDQYKRMLDFLKSEGKRIDENGDIVDIKMLVPDHIEIYHVKYPINDGDSLYIGLDDQLLYYNNRFHVWGVCPLHDGYNRVQCELVKCDRGDLKEGDTFLHSLLDVEDSKQNFYNYNNYLKDGKFAHFSSENNGVKVRDYTGGNVYKLKPIDG